MSETCCCCGDASLASPRDFRIVSRSSSRPLLEESSFEYSEWLSPPPPREGGGAPQALVLLGVREKRRDLVAVLARCGGLCFYSRRSGQLVTTLSPSSSLSPSLHPHLTLPYPNLIVLLSY